MKEENKQENIQRCFHKYEYKAPEPRGYKLNAKCLLCGDEIKDVFPARTFEGFLRRWVHGKLSDVVLRNGKEKTITQRECGNYRATNERVYYWGSGRNTNLGEDILAIKLPDGRLIGNASRLPRCGSYRKGGEAPAQRVLQQLEIALIPFNVFEEAKMDLFKAKVVHQGQSEKLTLPKLEWNKERGMLVPVPLWKYKYSKEKPKGGKIRLLRVDKGYGANSNKINGYSYEEFNPEKLEQRHFIGAMLLNIEDKYFLFDIDRRELEFYNFNAFLSQLPRPCKTIEEAYDMLIPDKVRQALKKGLKVERQGEWFFIPAKLPKAKKIASKKLLELTNMEKIPKDKQFDIDYNKRPWGSIGDHLLVTSTEIQNYFSEHKVFKVYENNHKKRVKDYNKAMGEFLSNYKKLRNTDPDKYAMRGQLRANNNRPNDVEKFVELPNGQFVKGEVTHTGREHEPLHLKDWYIAVPNTATASFTIQGAID